MNDVFESVRIHSKIENREMSRNFFYTFEVVLYSLGRAPMHSFSFISPVVDKKNQNGIKKNKKYLTSINLTIDEKIKILICNLL